MEAFGTFKIDHKVLDPGLYMARIDNVTEDTSVYTIDVRTKKPYREGGISSIVAHSVEHIIATGLEKQELKKVYWGPMGCATGYYYLFSSSCKDESQLAIWVAKALINAVDLWDRKRIPFDSEDECGNCHMLAKTEKEMQFVEEELLKIREIASNVLSNAKFDEYTYL